MIDWLSEFLEHAGNRPDSCSASKDCDHERDAAWKEILRLRRYERCVNDLLDMEETVQVNRFQATRIISVTALKSTIRAKMERA